LSGGFGYWSGVAEGCELIELENAVVYHGSNLDVLPTLPDNSVDAIVTDPPYELGFMGKSWDSSGIAYSVELWAECLRVLKPGGHLLAFGGSRTWHRIAVAIEDAGFDVRDSIAWLYGSGFPKSLDISKAIDKRRDDSKDADKLVEYLQSKLPAKIDWQRIDELLRTVGSKQKFFTLSTSVFKSRVMTWNQWQITKEWLALDAEMDSEVWRLNGRKGKPGDAWLNREVIGTNANIERANSIKGGQIRFGAKPDGSDANTDLTAPATEEAKKWQGWGTALKPAFEPVVVARKPLVGTVAANVLLWGVGGLNIDGSRVGTEGGTKGADFGEQGDVYGNGLNGNFGKPVAGLGRWPANIILDEYTAELLDQQSGERGATATTNPKTYEANNEIRFASKSVTPFDYADKGGASRFFYVAKASKKDRNEGLEDLEGKEIGAKGNGLGRACATCSASVLDGCECADRTFVNPTRQNFHPTVKPTALMEYLVKLVTPPGGTVLDPFTGSGSTGKAALLNGFKFIGIELTADYLPIIEGRLKHAAETYANQAKEEETKEQETLF
jgi:DNA modification methylase